MFKASYETLQNPLGIFSVFIYYMTHVPLKLYIVIFIIKEK